MKLNVGRWPIRGRGRVLHNRVLDSDGEYREVAQAGQTVELEVVSAPGLAAGTHLHVTTAAARAMTPERSRAAIVASRAARAAMRLVSGHAPRLKSPTA